MVRQKKKNTDYNPALSGTCLVSTITVRGIVTELQRAKYILCMNWKQNRTKNDEETHVLKEQMKLKPKTAKKEKTALNMCKEIRENRFTLYECLLRWKN